MKQKLSFNLKSITVTAYAAVALLFIIFSVYMFSFENNNVYSARSVSSYKKVEDYTVNEIKDQSAPIGLRREFSWQIGDIENNENCLMFYVVHSYAEVRFDGE